MWLEDKEEREKKKGSPKILVKSDHQAGICAREFPVQQGKDGKSESGRKPPENTPVNRVVQIETGNDQKYPCHAEKSIKDRGNLEFFPEKKGFQESCEHGKTGIGQEANSDGGNLDGLKKCRPVDCQDESQENKKTIVFRGGDGDVFFRDEEKEKQGETREKDAS
jgi:hypothetical protein